MALAAVYLPIWLVPAAVEAVLVAACLIDGYRRRVRRRRERIRRRREAIRW